MAALALADAEQRYFATLGIDPAERYVDLKRVGATVRVLEVGEGPPVLFVHGAMTAGGCWADLASLLPAVTRHLG